MLLVTRVYEFNCSLLAQTENNKVLRWCSCKVCSYKKNRVIVDKGWQHETVGPCCPWAVLLHFSCVCLLAFRRMVKADPLVPSPFLETVNIRICCTEFWNIV